MAISGINPHEISQPFYDPWSPLDPPTEVGRKIPDEYNKDTIKQAKNAEDTWGYIYPEVAGMFMPQQHQSSIDPTTSRPKLDTPTMDSKKFSGIEEEVGQLLPKVEEGDQSQNSKQDKALDKHLGEIALMQMFIQCMKTQRDQNEVNAELTLDTIQKNQSANKKIKEEYFNKMDEHIENNKKSKILKWVNWILYGALAVVGLASLALTITASVATGGAALPLALTVTMGLVNGVLSMGSGTASIFKGVLDYNNKKIVGVLEEKKWERLLNTRKIKSGMDEMRQSMEVISDNWKELIKVVNNWLQASLNN